MHYTFHHLPKTGGSTLRIRLEDRADKKQISKLDYAIGPNTTKRTPGTDFTWLRNPLDRDISHFNYDRSKKDEKISVFEKSGVVANGITLPIDLYRLGIITTPELYEAERVDRKDFFTIMASPLTRPTNNRPIYTRDESGVKVYNSSGQILTNLSCTYVKQPSKVEWGYVVTTSGGSTTNGKALYNPSTSTNFEHHRSDETELVLKILELAGIVINKPGLVQLAGQEDLQKIQQEKQ